MTSSHPQQFPQEAVTPETLRTEGFGPLFEMEYADALEYITLPDGVEPLTDEEFDLLRSAIPQRGKPVLVDEGIWHGGDTVYAVKTTLSDLYAVRVVGDQIKRKRVNWNRVVYSVAGIRTMVLSRRVAPNDRGLKDVLALVAEENEDKAYIVRLKRYPAAEKA